MAFLDTQYSVYYEVLPANEIFNCLAPSEFEVNRKKEFYQKLEESILNEGFKNPIMISAGLVPKFQRYLTPSIILQNEKEALVCGRYGGSRLWVAQKHGMDVPCFISDHVGRFAHLTEITTLDEIISKYDPPLREVVVCEDGLWGKVK